MKLASVSVNQHVFDGQVNGQPIRLLLSFDNGRNLRLRGAADGEAMIVDDFRSTNRSTWANAETRL